MFEHDSELKIINGNQVAGLSNSSGIQHTNYYCEFLDLAPRVTIAEYLLRSIGRVKLHCQRSQRIPEGSCQACNAGPEVV